MEPTVLDPAVPTGDGHRPGERIRRLEERRRRRSRRRRLVLFAVAALSLLLALSIGPALDARRHLLAGREALTGAGNLLLEGREGEAAAAFREAAARFGRAEGAARHPALLAQGLLPYLGRTADALSSMAEAGTGIAEAGATIADGLAGLPGGIGALAPAESRIPIDALRALAPAATEGRARLEEAARTAHGLPTSLVPGPVAEAGAAVRHELDRVLPLARAADEMLRHLPAFAGGNGSERRYFVAAQNPAEARGTGGFIGAYSVLTIRDGRTALAPFRDIRELRDVPVGRAPWPSESLREVYGPFNAAGFWRSTNVPPDAAVAGSLIEALYERTEGVVLDGTIFVDPQALADLLSAAGPVRVPALGHRLSADTAVPFLTNEAYFLADDQAERKDVLGDAARAVLRRFLAGVEDPARGVRSLVDAAAGGHVLLHAADPDVQRAFELAGVAGRFGVEDGGDFFSVVKNQTAGTKVDYYIARDVRYEVVLGEHGSASATATVALENDAPAGAEPSYALGPYGGQLEAFDLAPGEDFTRLFLYCADGCRLASARADGEVVGVEPYRDAGLAMYATSVRIPPQTTKRIQLVTDLPRAWRGNAAGGTYRFRFQDQPTIRPTTVTIVVRAPRGMSISWTSEPMAVEGGTATWAGSPGRELDLEVRFGRALVPGLWARFLDLLSRPVLRL